tara:strand:+ start:1127 stop:1318 length:192 start_codon:yes stop_codon:yes gene_type:complete
LLIDTSVWLDLAKAPRQVPLLDALFTMTETSDAALIVPQIVLDEFERNRSKYGRKRLRKNAEA